MKRYFICTVLFFISVFLFSCKKTELITYNKSRVLYFSIASTDSISVNFSALSDDIKDTLLKIPIGLLGVKLNEAAPFDIAIDEQITTAIRDQDFVIPAKFSFLPQTNIDTVSIKFNRTAKLASGEYVLGLELKQNQQFNNQLFETNAAKTQARKIRIFLTDILKPTGNWANSPGSFGTEYYLGRFTKRKLLLLVQLFGYWTFKEMYENIDFYPDYFGDILNDYLKEQQAAGISVLEDDGTLMETGKYYK